MILGKLRSPVPGLGHSQRAPAAVSEYGHNTLGFSLALRVHVAK